MPPADLLILVIEDNPEDYALLTQCLQENFDNATVFHAATLREGIKYIEKQTVHVILLDLTLPDETGIQTFRSVNARAPLVPVIILSGLGDY